MNFFSRKRLVAFMIACLLLFGSCFASAEQVLVMNSASVYASADASAKVLGNLNAGTQLELIAEKNGWSKVSLNGRIGYMSSDALAELTTYSSGKTGYAAEDVVMYKSFSTSSDVICTIEKGEKLTVSATAGDWACVRYSGKTGFVLLSALTTKAPAVEVEETSITAYAAVENAKVYNASGKVIGTVALNTEVIIRETRDGICRVERNGNTAYMKKSQLSETRIVVEEPDDGIEEITPTTFYVKNEGAKLYNTSGKVIGTLSVNTAVTVSAYKDKLAKVSVNGKTAIMYRSDLSSSKVEVEQPDDGIEEITPTTFYVKNEGAKVYNAKGKVIGTLSINTAVTVSAYKDKLAKVSVNGKTAIMYRSDLSSSKVEVEQEDNGITEISPTTFYVKNEGAKVYNASGKVIGTLPLNTAVTVSAYKDKLAKITVDGKTAVMYRSDLSESKIKVETEEEKNDGITEITPTTFYVKNEGARVLDADGNVIGTLALNTAVTVTAYSDDLAKVTNGSTVGFMKKSDLSDSKVKEEEPETSMTLQYGDSGEAVKNVQTRLQELGYFQGNIGGNYLDLTRAAVIAFQKAAGLSESGIVDETTLTRMFAADAPKLEKKEPTGDSTVAAATGTAKAMDWWTSGIQQIFPRGSVATVTDVQTGIAWQEKRSGGTNHADVQPLTAADTAAMKKAVGSWSWTRRPIFVTINGVNYAASMNCMPHGGGSITNNNFNGHHCIHFTNSRTHGSNKMCSLHQAAIQKAANATL